MRPAPSVRATTRRASVPSSIDTARELAGEGLRYVAWMAVNERGADLPHRDLGPGGSHGSGGVDPGHRPGRDRPTGSSVRCGSRDGTGAEVLFAPVLCRIAPRAGLVLATGERVPDEVDESLAILGTQAAPGLRRARAVRRAPREAQRGAVPAARAPQQRRGAHRRQRRSDPIPDAFGRQGARLPRGRPRRCGLRTGAAPGRGPARLCLPRAAGARRRPRPFAPSTPGCCEPTTR